MAEYIEREALQKRLEMHQVTNPTTIGKKQFREGYYLGLSETEIMIAQAPKADVAPVRHGEWAKTEDDWNSLTTITCSECHEEWCFETEEDVELLNYHYCPNCGARMDLGGDGNA